MSTKRKQVTLAVAGSVGIHLAVLFAWALAVQWFPGAQAANTQPPEQLKLEVVEETPEPTPKPEPELVPKAAAPKPVAFADTADMPEATQPPKDPMVQSDRDAEAASEFPASGDKPLPTQKGRPVPQFAFDTHPYVPGDAGKAAGPNVPENMPPPVPATAPPPPRPIAQSTPPPPAATPSPSNATDPRDMALVTPQSIPANPVDAEPNPYDPAFRPPATMTEPPRPTPVRGRGGGYQPQREITDMVGGVARRGVSSVASEATPAGRYKVSVKQAIERVWYKYYDARADMVSLGTVTMHFDVDRGGKILAPRVVATSANEALVSITLRAIAEAPIPPMPLDVAASANGGVLPMDINFNSL